MKIIEQLSIQKITKLIKLNKKILTFKIFQNKRI